MKFDRFTVALLVLNPNAPELDEQTENALQDAHMAFLADLHRAGYLFATGPLTGSPERNFRGLSIFCVDAEQARLLSMKDPAVKAERFDLRVLPWLVPYGAMTFSLTRFPRSMEEANMP
jgi:uncharacterized protein